MWWSGTLDLVGKFDWWMWIVCSQVFYFSQICYYAYVLDSKENQIHDNVVKFGFGFDVYIC
jgi:hypothetical protein